MTADHPLFPWNSDAEHPAGAFHLPATLRSPFTKAHAWATTILFDEHYARGLQRPADGEFIGSG